MTSPGPMTSLEAWAPDGIGEIIEGTDLVALLAGLGLRAGDVVLVTSKMVAKAEGRVRRVDRERAIDEETVRVVARRGPTRIVENRLGLVMAAAGVDASNVEAGSVVLLPEDPDASARALRSGVYDATGANVAVLITDTAGRAWRTGQTDIAVGVAGLDPLHDFAGRVDGYGNPLAVTAPAVADELAGLAELVTGKLGGRPVSVVRGLEGLVLKPGQHGPGAAALQRPREQDMFALGSREAVLAAIAGTDADCFGSPAPLPELLDALRACGLDALAQEAGALARLPARPEERAAYAERARLVAHALGWRVEPGTDGGAVLVVRREPTGP